ncbi:MAG: hypothetical protein QOF48_3791 [Verrucomicrobiota bacterium]
MPRPPKKSRQKPSPHPGATVTPAVERSAPATPVNMATVQVARVLLCVALGVSIYLAWISFTHGSLAGCGPESECDRVLQSRWSRWFGVPVSAFAVLVDATTLLATFASVGGAPSAVRAGARSIVLLGATLILGAGSWFVALQLFAVGICPYCMTAHAAGLVAAVLLWIAFGRATDPAPDRLRPALISAGAALVILVGGQLVYKPATGRETRITRMMPTGPNVPDLVAATQSVAVATNPLAVAPPSDSATNPAGTAVPSTNAPRPAYTPDRGPVSAMKRPFTIYQGMFAFDLEEVPVIGHSTNAQAVVSLFDYSCHHCRLLHPLLQEMQRAFSNRLVIASLPMPLDEKCNRTIKRTSAPHTNACAYAHIGLAVWRANPARHEAFDDWLMTGPEPPPVDAAVNRAVSLVGSNAFVTALNDPWVERQLQFDIGIYDVAFRSGHGAMPQLIVGNTISEGVRTLDELLKMLADNLGLKSTP